MIPLLNKRINGHHEGATAHQVKWTRYRVTLVDGSSDVLSSISSYTPQLHILMSIYGLLPATYRKALLLITRVRTDISQPLLRRQLPRTLLPEFLSYIRGRRYTSKYSWLDMMQSVSLVSKVSDIGNSILSAFFRSRGYDENNYEFEVEEVIKMLVKEIDATQGPDRPSVLNYDVWFKDDWSKPLFEGADVRYFMNQEITSVFDDFRHAFMDKLVCPRASKKTMSYQTARNYGMRSITGVEYLRLAFNGEGMLHGDLEVRQAWRYNDLSPRVYFSQGGVAFRSSMFAQEIFNTLVDSFEVSHRRRRYDLERLDIDQEDEVWVYDYSSFTSNLTEQKYFLQELADYCKGYPLYVFDVSYGKVKLDLGSYIEEYSKVCCVGPKFYLSDQLLRLTKFLPATYTHQKAGALGVYGNLASATVLHGLFSMNVFGSVRKSSVVGDDGLGVNRPHSDPIESGEVTELDRHSSEIKDILRLLGNIAELKFAVLSSPKSSDVYRWTYLKRALVRHDESLELWDQEHLINLSVLLDQWGASVRKDPRHVEALVKSIVSQVTNLLYRIYRKQSSILDEELGMVCKLYREIYARYKLPFVGSMGGFVVRLDGSEAGSRDSERTTFRVSVPVCFIPAPEMAYYLRNDPIENLMNLHDWEEPVRIPVLRANVPYPDFDLMARGVSFMGRRSRFVSLCIKMDLLVEESMGFELARTREEFRLFRDRLISPEFDVCYRYEVVRQIPDYFRDLYPWETIGRRTVASLYRNADKAYYTDC